MSHTSKGVGHLKILPARYHRQAFCTNAFMIGLIIILAAIIIAVAVYADRRKRKQEYKLPATTKQLLSDNVPFYVALADKDKALFELRIKDFLANTSIRGVDVEVEDLDRILIAASAIMLIFSFPDWKYNNISEVLLYPGTFTKDYSTAAPDRNVLGMVGEGAMHREMILSKPSLRASYSRASDGQNTAIHEFAHLIDKADGETDGIPEYLLSQPQLLPWINLVHETINEMKKGYSDINPYGATSAAEFFAVITEYFFEKPEQLATHHPELFAMLEQMFHPQGK